MPFNPELIFDPQIVASELTDAKRNNLEGKIVQITHLKEMLMELARLPEVPAFIAASYLNSGLDFLLISESEEIEPDSSELLRKHARVALIEYHRLLGQGNYAQFDPEAVTTLFIDSVIASLDGDEAAEREHVAQNYSLLYGLPAALFAQVVNSITISYDITQNMSQEEVDTILTQFQADLIVHYTLLRGVLLDNLDDK